MAKQLFIRFKQRTARPIGSVSVVATYEKKALRLTTPFLVWVKDFKQLNRKGTPNNPEEATPSAKATSKKLQDFRVIVYQTAQALIASDGWETSTSKEFSKLVISRWEAAGNKAV